MLITGIILIVLSRVIWYFVGRRNFNRRNSYGVQEFKSYEHATATRIGEGFLKFIAYLLIAIGIIFVILHFTYSDHIDNPYRDNASKPTVKRHASIH